MTDSPAIVAQLAEFIDRIRLDKIPETVGAEARRCILDTVGVIIAGQKSSIAQSQREYARQTYAPGAAQILADGVSLQAPAAAQVNACAGHVYDFDDTSYTGIMHGSVAVLPAALAIAQQSGVGGKQLLEAFIAGVEVEYAIAEFCTTHIYFKGWWTSGVYGALGAAAASARLLGLDREASANAMAMAICNASGMKAAFGSDAKPLGIGMAAGKGVECALLAQSGLSGPIDVFENANGFLSLYNDGRYDVDRDLRLFGRWRLTDPGILFKSYPVCSAAQAGTELCRRLLEQHRLEADEIAAVSCDVPPLVKISLLYDEPKSIREAQFSMPFAVGCMLAFGQLGLEQLTPQTLTNPLLGKQMQKVAMQVPDYLANDDTVLQRCPEGAGVTLRTHDGREVGDFLDRPTGMPGNPVTDAALENKFLQCCRHGGLSPERACRIATRIWQLQELDQLVDFLE